MNNQIKIEQTFISECNDILSELENDFLFLEKELKNNPSYDINSEISKRILRNLHTLKGSSGLVEINFIPGYVHLIESAVKKSFKNSNILSSNINFFLTKIDYIKYLVNSLIFKKETIDNTEYNENLNELSSFLESKKEINPDKQRFDIFDQSPDNKPVKDNNPVLSIYYLRIRLNEKRIDNTWMPEDLLDDIYKTGKIIFIKGKAYENIFWETSEFSQCLFEWTIILETEIEYSKIVDVFLFFIEKNQIEIKLIDEETITDILKKLIADKIDSKKIENILSAWEDILSNTMLMNNIEDKKKDNLNSIVHNNDLAINDELKISSSKVNRLIDLIGELIISNSNLENIKLKYDNPELEQTQQKINNISKQLRDLSLSMKMVPIGQLLIKFHRMVRDLSVEFGKDIELFIEGENTEVDKSLFSILEESLLHIIRNAIDHGIELPEDRIKKKKDRTGKIYIKAYHENEQLVIEVSDDGKGLDKDKILKKGIEKNILKQSDNYSDDDIYKLIFEPNFSTNDSINLISGRGIGMDIVKYELLKSNGNIEIKTKKNEGTTFIIRLPLTLAIIEGFLIRIGINYFVLPLNFVLECLEINLEKLIEKKMVHNFREKYLNILTLDKIFNNISYDDNDCYNKAVVVIEIQDDIFGILADEIMGNIQVVIKPVSKQINQNKVLLGSTLLGSGEIALILDIRNLLGRINNCQIN